MGFFSRKKKLADLTPNNNGKFAPNSKPNPKMAQKNSQSAVVKGSTKKEVWRDSQGKLKCPGDACPLSPCSKNCPIYIATEAMMLMQLGEFQKTIETYKSAVAIAPDFAEAYNNMAACYGNLRDYGNAYKCYLKAYKLEGKKNALYGMAVAAKDLDNVDHSWLLCDVYDQKFKDYACSEVRKEILQKITEMTEAETDQPLQLSVKILHHLLCCGSIDGFLPADYGIPWISDLVKDMTVVCRQIKELNLSIQSATVLLAYAGMGATYLWNKDWEALKEKGIYESLFVPKGQFNIKEYVAELTGIGDGELEKLHGHLCQIGKYTEKIAKACSNDSSEAKYQALMAGFLYGEAIEMHKLGLPYNTELTHKK